MNTNELTDKRKRTTTIKAKTQNQPLRETDNNKKQEEFISLEIWPGR